MSAFEIPRGFIRTDGEPMRSCGERHPYRQNANFDNFYVITVVSNPCRYESRYRLYCKFKKIIESSGAKLITVEQAFGDRPFVITEQNNPYHVQIRTIEELWHKENMGNIGVRHMMQLDPKAKKFAFIDADCFPMVPAREWLEETIHALDHYQVVQMWEHLINFGPRNEPITGPQLSFMATYAAAGFTVPESRNVKHTLAGHSGMISLGRPGLAWAWNVDAYSLVGGFIDWCILGSGDWHMAHGLVGAMQQRGAEHKELSAYSKKLLHWQELAERWIKRDVGFVPVTVGHWFHGSKTNRQYGSRGKILIENQYNPETDIKYDAQGLIQLETYEPRQIRLRDQIRGYFRARNEDSTEV